MYLDPAAAAFCQDSIWLYCSSSLETAVLLVGATFVQRGLRVSTQKTEVQDAAEQLLMLPLPSEVWRLSPTSLHSPLDSILDITFIMLAALLLAPLGFSFHIRQGLG